MFAADEHITITKIGDKAGNMKKCWKQAKAKQDQSGWGVTLEDNTQSINEELEKTCTFFWRLDEIWGSRLNASTIPSSMESGNLSQLIDPPGTDTQPDTPLEWSPSPWLQRSPRWSQLCRWSRVPR